MKDKVRIINLSILSILILAIYVAVFIIFGDRSFAFIKNISNENPKFTLAVEKYYLDSKEIENNDTDNFIDNNDENEDNQNEDYEEYLVTRIIDGDTIEIETGDQVRYIGINTPETNHPTKPVECFGKEATQINRELVEGKEVILVKDVNDRDIYNRLLRYVYLEDGTFVNLALVEEGYATSYTFPPDISHQADFLSAETTARNENAGLWGECYEESANFKEGECVIKGNISTNGEKIYHVPGQKYYNQTVIDDDKGEMWFCSEEEAVNAGWRKSKI